LIYISGHLLRGHLHLIYVGGCLLYDYLRLLSLWMVQGLNTSLGIS
jgi:hypothetical protein